jgi:site-specific DNA-cytosine methylase
LKALELYAGIGGFAVAAQDRFQVACAIEQSDVVLSAYRKNFAHPTLEKNIAGLSPDDFARFDAALWWASPPCQPYTTRGRQRDLDDPRAKSFLKVIEAIRTVRPRAFALENVPAFRESAAHTRLLEALSGYRVTERVLCPTELGVPNKRRRYYLVASQDQLREMSLPRFSKPLSEYLGPPGQEVSDEILQRYRHAMSILEPRDPHAVASCFTSAYGRSPIQSGSFLAEGDRVRQFSPRELLRLFGFPENFVICDRPYRLIGNSLSVFAVRAVLSAIC